MILVKLFLWLFVIFCLLSFVFYPTSAIAQSSYNDYTSNYSAYRQAHNDYEIARSSYYTYRTLTARKDAEDKLRRVIMIRDRVMASYFSYLAERINDPTFSAIAKSEKDWLEEHRTKTEAAVSLEDLNSFSQNFASRFPQLNSEAKKATGLILLAKEDSLAVKLDELNKTVTTRLTQLGLSQRGLIAVQNKRNLADGKIKQARREVENAEEINLLTVQQRLLEANQYLRDAANFLLESAAGTTN